jgi:hypothetical protein
MGGYNQRNLDMGQTVNMFPYPTTQMMSNPIGNVYDRGNSGMMGDMTATRLILLLLL